jgi:hypothetical protein
LRRWLTVIGLSAVLIGLVAARQWVFRLHYVTEGAAGDLLYVAAFDDLTDEWQQYDGRLAAQIEAGELRISNGQNDVWAFSIAQPYFADFDLRVEARAVSGPLNNGYGVVFRYLDPRNLYMFLVSSDGYYQVRRVADGEQRELSGWIDSAAVRFGVGPVNELRVVARGDRFQFYINDQRMPLCVSDDQTAPSLYTAQGCMGGTMRDELIDSSLSLGQIGVVAQTLSEPDVVAAFDHLLVYSPEVES